MIKMQFDDFISLKAHTNLMLMNLKVKKIRHRDRQFNPIRFYKYPWIEYSIKKEAAFCFVCYLFAKEKTKKSAFIEGGWRTWNRNDALDLHVGGVTSAHNAAQERYNLFMTPHGAIDDKIVKVDNEERRHCNTTYLCRHFLQWTKGTFPDR